MKKDLGLDQIKSFSYDLDEKTVVVPNSYSSRLHEIANHSWDVWGLTRMGPTGKWHKAYSRHHVSTGDEIYNTLSKYLSFISCNSASSNLYLKDPRLIFAFPAYINALKQSTFRIIVINRNSSDLLSSMRAHYGKRLFTEDCIDDLGFVSNHFNYRIEPQNFQDYCSSVDLSIEILKDIGLPFLKISYDKIMNSKTRKAELRNLSEFIEADLDSSILRDPS